MSEWSPWVTLGPCAECCGEEEAWDCVPCLTCCYSTKSKLRFTLPPITYTGADALKIAAVAAYNALGGSVVIPLYVVEDIQWAWDQQIATVPTPAYQFAHDGGIYRLAFSAYHSCVYDNWTYQCTPYRYTGGASSWISTVETMLYSSNLGAFPPANLDAETCCGFTDLTPQTGWADTTVGATMTGEVLNNKCCSADEMSCIPTADDACPDGALECGP